MAENKNDFEYRRLLAVSRTQAAVSRALRTIRDIDEMLQTVCSLAVEVGGYRMVVVHRYDETTGLTRPIAVAGGACEGAVSVTDADCPTAQSLRGGHSVAVDNAHALPADAGRGVVSRCGFASAAAIPLRLDERLWGTISLHAGEPNAFGPEEVSLLEELGADIEWALGQCDLQRRAVRAEERLRTMAETIDEVFWMTTPQSNEMLYVSPSFEALWGLPVEAVQREPRLWLDAVHPDDLLLVLDGMRKQEQGPHSMEFRIVRPDGSVRWVNDRAYPRFGEDGRPSVICGIVADVTERHTIQAQLVNAQKQEAIALLAATVTHELKNLLLVIDGHCQLLQELELPAEATDSLTEIRAASRRAAAFSRQMLAVARREEGRREIIDLNWQVKKSATTLSTLLGRHVAVQSQLAEQQLMVDADSVRLDQVLLNLALNAREAMSAGGRLTFETSEVTLEPPHAGHWAVVKVRDEGCGIAPDVLPHIFTPFFTTKKKDAGSGLGLAAVQSIVDEHRGWVDVASTVGVGTEILVHLPLAAH